MKATDEFLDRVMGDFSRRVDFPQGYLRKSDYHKLARFVAVDEIDGEIVSVLDRIYSVAEAAKPVNQL